MHQSLNVFVYIRLFETFSVIKLVVYYSVIRTGIARVECMHADQYCQFLHLLTYIVICGW